MEIHHLQIGDRETHVLRELAPTHPRHDEIGQEQIEWTKLLGELQGLIAAAVSHSIVPPGLAAQPRARS
jgi:hypothetical protein